MQLDKLKELISKIPAPYQDVEIDGQLLVKGTRITCPARWEMLYPLLRDDTVIVDVGSDLGYFASRIAEKFPNSLVLSFEENENAARVQREIMRLKNLYNVVVCNHKIWLKDFQFLCTLPEAIDTIIFFAVLHHYEAEEERKVLSVVSKMIPQIVIEYTKITGGGAFGGKAYLDFIQELSAYYKQVQFVGENVLGPSETRVVCRGRTPVLAREELRVTHNHRLEYDSGKWTLKSKIVSTSKFYPKVKQDFITGFNVFNLLFFNPIWPEPEWWQQQAVLAYENLIKDGEQPTNIHTPNLLMTPKGLRVIEYKHPGAPFNIGEARENIARIKHTFEIMKPIF